MRSTESGLLFSDRVFYAAIEGSTSGGVLPQMIRYSFDSSTGTLTETGAPILFPGITQDWNIHHFGIGNGIMMVPISIAGQNGIVFSIDMDTWTLTGKSYTVGLGCGHADYSKALDTWAITNHYGNFVSIIEMSNDAITSIVVASKVESYGSYIQSHANHISKDGLFYYFFQTADGIFMEIDLSTRILSRQVVTGGKPIQSYS